MTPNAKASWKVCRQLGWKGDVRLLWQALDADGAGPGLEVQNYAFHSGAGLCSAMLANSRVDVDAALQV